MWINRFFFSPGGYTIGNTWDERVQHGGNQIHESHHEIWFRDTQLKTDIHEAEKFSLCMLNHCLWVAWANLISWNNKTPFYQFSTELWCFFSFPISRSLLYIKEYLRLSLSLSLISIIPSFYIIWVRHTVFWVLFYQYFIL